MRHSCTCDILPFFYLVSTVASFDYNTLGPDSIILEWTRPTIANSEISGYKLSYEGTKLVGNRRYILYTKFTMHFTKDLHASIIKTYILYNHTDKSRCQLHSHVSFSCFIWTLGLVTNLLSTTTKRSIGQSFIGV